LEGFKMRKTLRLGSIGLALAFSTFVLAGASAASNHAVFNDPAGDIGSSFAPDITALEVTSADDGAMTFRISINEQAATFYVGDTVTLAIDVDLNASTGATVDGLRGVDSAIYIRGERAGAGGLTYTSCTWGRTAAEYSCKPYKAEDIKHVKTGTNSHAVTFSARQGNWFTIGLRIYATHTGPSGTVGDRVPDTGIYRYDTLSDADGDRVSGSSDECPRFSGGAFDTDQDGCPPTLPVPKFRWHQSGSFGGTVVFDSVRVTNASSSTAVTARFSGFTVRRRGSGALRVSGRRIRIGSVAAFIYSNPNYFGRYQTARVTRAGFSGIHTDCTPPGKTTFISCQNLKG
jgi:hypothetical protein